MRILQKFILLFLYAAAIVSCNGDTPAVEEKKTRPDHPGIPGEPFVMVLGVAQDAGYPQAGCKKDCCARTRKEPMNRRLVSCIAIIDPVSKQRWIFDATPDFPGQLHLLDSLAPYEKIDGIFLTHAHMGHYTGLLHLGREVMNAKKVPVYVNLDMSEFLQSNKPWSQLVTLENIDLQPIKYDSVVKLNERISVQAFLVPHRAEFTETYGYRIMGENFNIIFIPDIDKWEKWEKSLPALVRENDRLFIDGTFYKDGELAGRNMKEIPHPFIEETMRILDSLPAEEKAKVFFIHLNHTNPALIDSSDAVKEIRKRGYGLAKQLQMELL